MISGPGLSALVLVLQFAASPASALIVNCNAEGLEKIPDVPAATAELHLQRNRLSSVPPGHFDKLGDLRLLDLSGNPFHCGCNIQYLRLWLLRNRDVVTTPPRCSSPASLAGRPIGSLRDGEFSHCARNPCGRFNLVAVFTLGILNALLLWCLRLARGLTFTLGIGEKHAGFAAEDLRSLKPKHRAREKVDVLHQVTDRQHSVKIKES